MPKPKKFLKKYCICDIGPIHGRVRKNRNEHLFDCFCFALKKLKLIKSMKDGPDYDRDNIDPIIGMVDEFYKFKKECGNDRDSAAHVIHWATEKWGKVDNKRVIKVVCMLV